MLLHNRTILISGLLSKRSIAYGIAQWCFEQGAQLAFTYENERVRERVAELANSFHSNILIACDVSNDHSIEHCFSQLAQHWTHLDGVVHAIAYAPREAIAGDFLDACTRENFRIAHDISAYSFPAMLKAARGLLHDGSSALTISYLGARQVLPNYNLMDLAKASLEASVRYLAQELGAHGIRVNAISAGPIRTLAASGIKSFRKMLDANEKIAPLKRNVTIEDVGNAALFLCSPWANGITGEILYVDAGFNTVGMSASMMDAD